MIFETARLALREMTLDDLDFVAEMLADPEVMRFYPRPLSRLEARDWLERQRRRYADHGHGLWLVEERETGLPVGQVGLLAQEVDGRVRPEIGWLLHRPFWGRGLATEAGLAVRRHAFDTLAKPEVISLIRPENTPSQAVARRVGLRAGPTVTFHGYRHIVFRATPDPVAP